MNRLTKNAIGFIAAFLLLGIAGRCDYNEQVIYSMPDDTYQLMKVELNNPSDTQLVDEYMNDPDYWDSLAFDCVYR